MNDIRKFIDGFKEFIGEDDADTVGHAVLSDLNLDDSDIAFQIDYIQKNWLVFMEDHDIPFWKVNMVVLFLTFLLNKIPEPLRWQWDTDDE